MKRSQILAALFTALVATIPECAHGASVGLTWAINAEPDVVGYRLYRGSFSRAYDTVKDVGKTNLAFADGLIFGSNYWFAVTAYNSSNLESPPSNEVEVRIPMGEPATPPAGLLAQRTGDKLTVQWQPNPEAEIALRYRISWITLGATNWVTLDTAGTSATFTVPARDYLLIRVAAETPSGVGPYRELLVPGFPKAPVALAVTPNSIRWTVPP